MSCCFLWVCGGYVVSGWDFGVRVRAVCVLKANVGLLCVFNCCAATLILSFLAFFSPCDSFAFLCSLQLVLVASFASLLERSAFRLFIVDGFSFSVLYWLWLSFFPVFFR